MQQDYLLKQTEQLGYALANVLSKLLGMKGSNTMLASLDNILSSEDINIRLDEYLQFDQKEISNFFKCRKEFDNGNIEKFADIIKVLVDDEVNVENKVKLEILYIKTLEYVQSNSNTYSLSIGYKIANIRDDLKRNIINK